MSDAARDVKDASAYDHEAPQREREPSEGGTEVKGEVYEADTAHIIDKKGERRLCRKLDVRLMPVLAIMCTFSWAHETPLLSLSCRPLSRPAYPARVRGWKV